METLNNFLIYALQSPKKRHNLYVGQTDNYEEENETTPNPKVVGVVTYEGQSKNTNGKNMKRIVLMEGLTKEQADWEKHYIKIFDCQAPSME